MVVTVIVSDVAATMTDAVPVGVPPSELLVPEPDVALLPELLAPVEVEPTTEPQPVTTNATQNAVPETASANRRREFICKLAIAAAASAASPIRSANSGQCGRRFAGFAGTFEPAVVVKVI
jgi:hypothetical protein